MRPVFNNSLPLMQTIRHDTRAWKAQVWVSFGTAVTLCASGLAWLPGQDLDRAFMVMGYLFTLSTAFALAKWTGLGLMLVYGLVAAILSGRHPRVAVLHALAAGSVGGARILLKAFVH